MRERETETETEREGLLGTGNRCTSDGVMYLVFTRMPGES